MDYKQFLNEKADYGARTGFDPVFMPGFLKDFQSFLVDWSVQIGRGAIFADCGMGKTPMQLVWAENIVRKTNKPVLIIAPLSVSGQTLREATKFEIEAYPAVPDRQPEKKAIYITNYERLHHFDASHWGGVACDESSILKNFDGTYRAEITEFMRTVPYRTLWTATAAPNDWDELGTSSEALGYLGYTDMISRFFKTDSGSVIKSSGGKRNEKLNLRNYAQVDFWRWVASWSRAARKPSDLGDFSDSDFVLPQLTENDVEIKGKPLPGMLVELAATNFREERAAMRNTIEERCEVASELAQQHGVSAMWCHLNDEGDYLERITPNSVQVSGSDSIDKKEEAVDWFINGSDSNRILISKPRILGFGMNFQHCSHATYFPTHSFEQYYQTIRRFWRFGQSHPVTIDRVYTNGGARMLDSINRKSTQADTMFAQLTAHINNSIKIKNTHKPITEMELPQWLTK